MNVKDHDERRRRGKYAKRQEDDTARNFYHTLQKT